MFWKKKNQLTRQQQELEKVITEHKKLCEEAKEQIKEYKELNRQLKIAIAQCNEKRKKVSRSFQEMRHSDRM